MIINEKSGLTRRAVLGGLAAFAARVEAQAVDAAAVLEVNDLDRRIWEEELEEFVPKKMWDMHSHLGLYRFDVDPKKEAEHHYALKTAALEKTATMETLQNCNRILYPGRDVTPFVLPNPYQYCDCEDLNAWAAAQVKAAGKGACTMVVKPEMKAAYVDQQVRKHGYLGYKPYMWYARVANWHEARITDYLIEPHLEVANQYGLIMAVHLSKSKAISDPENLADLARLTKTYPRVRWLLLHNARSYSAWAIEKAIPRLKDVPNLWFESSSVCESDAFYPTLKAFGPDRFCYGTDDIPVGITRGKYIAWGYGWEQLDSVNFPFKPTHCDPRLTFVRYEMLRALKRATEYAGLSRGQVDNIFWGNGQKMVEAVRADLAQRVRLG